VSHSREFGLEAFAKSAYHGQARYLKELPFSPNCMSTGELCRIFLPTVLNFGLLSLSDLLSSSEKVSDLGFYLHRKHCSYFSTVKQQLGLAAL